MQADPATPSGEGCHGWVRRARNTPSRCTGVVAAECTQGKRTQHGKPRCVIRDDQPDAREGQAGRIDAGTSPCTSKHPTAMTSQIMRSRRYVISIAAPGRGNGKVCAESSICNRRFISSMRAGYRSRIASLLTACHPRRSWSRIGDRASVRAATRVNAEQASKRTMCRPTRRPLPGKADLAG